MSEPQTSLHYAANGNLVNNQYAPGADGFNLADVSSLSALDSLPTGVKGLIWLGNSNGADAAFQSAVNQYVGDPKLYGFYLADEPNPTGLSAATLKAESDYIHAHVPGAKTFMVMENMGTPDNPSYANTYNPANTDIDLFGLDPYPIRPQFSGGADYSVIPAAVNAAEAEGIPLSEIVPVYQAFGGGGYSSWTMPTAAQEQQILQTWGASVPSPSFDYTYSWGVQDGDSSLSGSPTLQQVFAAHNAASGTGSGGGTGGGTDGGGTTTVAIPAGTGTFSSSASNTLFSATAGNHTIFIGGSYDQLTATGGTENVTALQGNNTITTGAGNDTIHIAGTSNVVNAGAGTNTISDTGSGNTIVLPPGGGGMDIINGSVLQANDLMDLRPVLAATKWDGSNSTLGTYLSTRVKGSDTILSVKAASGGASHNIARFTGAGAISLATLIQHAIL
jgi:hypothetical protein